MGLLVPKSQAAIAIGRFLFISLISKCTLAVSEINGAPCTPRAHFHSRVHDFWRCAPGVCMFFKPSIIAQEGAWRDVRVHSFRAPCECTK